MIRDLLNPSSGILELREDAKGGTQVAGLSQIKARSTDEVIIPLCEEKKQQFFAFAKSKIRINCAVNVQLINVFVFCFMNRKVPLLLKSKSLRF